MNEQELSKKLAEWAGFTESHHISDDGYPRFRWQRGDAFWRRPDRKTTQVHCPNFTQSLDACFKWLVPKLNGMGWYVNLMQVSLNAYWKCQLWSPFDGTAPTITLETLQARPVVQDNDPALALCLAIEKLIDGEKNERS